MNLELDVSSLEDTIAMKLDSQKENINVVSPIE